MSRNGKRTLFQRPFFCLDGRTRVAILTGLCYIEQLKMILKL